MAQYLTLPNGNYVEVPDGVSYDEALARAQQKFPEAFKAPEAKRTGLGAALSKGFENVISSGRTGIEALLGSPEEAARQGLERGQTMAEKYPEQVSLEKVKKAYEERGVLPAAGEAISQVPAALAEQAPNMAATIAGAQAGQRLGGMFGAPGRLIGAGLGAAVPGLTQMFGSNIERQAAEQEKEGKPISINRGAAGAAALPQAALDVVSQYIPLGSKLVSKLVGIPEAAFVSKSAAQVQKLADERLYATLAKGLGVGVMAEVPTEVAQQMLERAQAGLSLTSPDALKEYGETAYQVLLLAPLGAAGRTFQRGAARSDIRQKQEDAVAEERSLQALKQEKATQALVARRGTDDYAREIEQKYKDMAAKQLEYETISKSKVADDDLLGQQAKRDARKARQALMTSDEFKDTLAEYSKLKTSGIYDKIAEQDRIAGMTPQEYALEGTQSVTSSKTKAVAPDLEGYYEQQILAPGAVDTKPALDYAKQQLALVDEHFYGAASAEQIIEYLAHNPKLASQIVNYKIRLPGMSVKDSRDTLNDLKQLLDERQTQATAQGRAGTDLNKARLNTVEEEEAAALEDQRQMRQAYEMQQEGRNATDIERIQPQKPTVQQGELFGGEQQRINMPQTGTRVDIDAQIADLEKQLDAARTYGAPDAVGRRSNRERVSSLLEQIQDLKDRQAQIASGAPMGGNTDAVRAYIAAGTPDRAPNETIDEWYARTEKVKPKFSNLPEQEAARREAVTARDAAYAQLKGGKTEARQDVLDNLVKEITAARGKLRPETITQIERQANGLIDSALRYGQDITPAFEALAARWRAGTQTGAFGAAQAVPTTTTQDMLLTQMDTAFGQRDRYDPQTLSILDQIAQNFGAVSANEDRRSMVGEWLNRVSTTGRSSPEMTRDVQAELAELERAKVSETETPTRETAFGLAAKPTQTAVQQELGAEFMPEQVSPQSATRIVDGKVQYVAPEDRGPLQGSSAERYAPTQKGTIFESFEDLNKYLASDYLKAARQEMGITRQTVARLGLQVKEHEAKIANITKQVDALKERKAKLAESEAAESKAAKNIVAAAEVRLEAVLNRLSDELEPLRITYMQARSQVEQIAQRSEETSRLVADNIVNFKNMDDRAVEAAQETAKAKTALLQARNKLGSLAEKLPGIQTAQQEVITALQRQRNPLLNESQQKLQDLQKQLSKARVVQPRTVARLQQEIADLQDLMDTQRVNPYIPSAAFITFLNNDLQLQLDAQEESRKMDNAARALLRAGLDLEIAAKDLDADISQHSEILAIKKEIGTAKTLAFDALRGINKELADIDKEVEKAESAKTIEATKAQNIEDEILATSESRGFAAQMANVPIEPMSAAERDSLIEQDRKRMEAFQESTDRLEAIPGQRIDFSKRQELLELAALTEENFNELDAFIEEMETGVEEMQVRAELAQIKLDELQEKAKSYRGPRKNLAEAKPVFAQIEQLQKQIETGNQRVETLRKSIEDFTKARVRKEAAVVAAKRVTSSDPEVYAEVTKIITARAAKLERTIDKKQANLVKKGQEITALARDIKAKDLAGKTSPEQLTKMRARLKTLRDSQTDRAKEYKKFLKERAVLQAQQSNRLGIVRTNVLTGKSVAGDRTKKAGVAEQEEFDAEVDRVQELGRATDRLAVLEKALAAMQKAAAPKTEAKQAERAKKLAKLQADINTQQALIDSLQPRQKGKVSQAARVQSAAPSKLRAGTPESKENPGVTRQPIVEKRELVPLPSEKAVADANAFVARVNAAKTPKELDAEFAAKNIEAQNQILEALDSNIERLTVMAGRMSNELYDLNLIPKDQLKPFHATNREKLRSDMQSAEKVLDQTLLAKERYLAEQDKAEVAETGDEGVPLPSGYRSFTGKDIIGNEDAGFEFSRGVPTEGLTTTELRNELRRAVGDEDTYANKVSVFASVDEFLKEKPEYVGQIPSDAKAFVDPDTERAYMFAENIGKGDGMGILLHEVGVHIGFRNFFNTAQFYAIAKTVRNWANAPINTLEGKIGRAAKKRAEDAGTSAAQMDDELIAYAVEEAVKAGVEPAGTKSGSAVANWLRMVVNAFNKALKNLGIAPEKLTVGDLVNMAYGAAQIELKGTWHGTAGTFTEFDHAYMGAGEGTQVFGWGTYRAQRKSIGDYYRETAAEAAIQRAYDNPEFTKWLDDAAITIDGVSLKTLESKGRRMRFNAPKPTAPVPTNKPVVNAQGKVLAVPVNQPPLTYKKDVPNFPDNIRQTVLDALAEVSTNQLYNGKPFNAVTALKDVLNNANTKESKTALAWVERNANRIKGGAKTKAPVDLNSTGRLLRTLHEQHEDAFFNLDNQIPEQSDRVRTALEKMFNSLSNEQKAEFNRQLAGEQNPTGKEVYDAFKLAIGNQKTVSERLNSFGVAGNKFLDRLSRGKPVTEDSRYNYVDFLDKDQGAAIVASDINPVGPASGLLFSKKAPKYANDELAGAGAVADKLIAKQRGFMDTIKEEGSGLKLMTQFVDRFAPLEKLSKYMDSLKGLQMMYYTRMYDQRMNFVAQSVGNGALQLTEKKRADGRTERIVESVGGASLKGVINVLKKGNDLVGSPEGNSRLFSMYLVAKRAERVGLSVLNYGGRVTEADLKDVREAVANTPGLKTIYEQAQREYNMYNRDMLQFAVESGAISAKTRETLIQAGDYVPYYRERNGGVDMMLGNQTISRIGNTKEQPYLKELTGGDEPILDFMTSAVQNTNMLTDMSLRNLATKNAVFELQELGMATIGKGDSASGTNVVKFKDKGEDKFAMLNTDDVVVGGKRFPTGIPADLLVKGMAGIPTQNTILTKLLGGPARILRKSVVLNPLYAAKQLFRDSLAAPLLSGADFAPVFGALKEIGKASGKTLEQRGITGGQVFTGTQEDLAMVLRDMAANKSGWAQGLAQLESMSMEADALTRRAQYNSYIKQGLSEMEATYMALESMNFSKRGMSPAVHTLATVIPFFNAQIQSMNVLFKAFSGNMPFNEKLKIREKLYQRGMLIAGMTMTYAALMQDDEAYQNATPEQKYASWFIRVPGFDEAVRIPIPFEIGYIFKAIPEAIVNSMMNQNGGEEAAKAFKQIALQIIPGGSSYGMPQAIKPLLEAGLGKSFYTGRDLESAHEKTLEPGQRYRETTTELAKLVGKTVGVSPIKIDSLIQGYFSATGLALVDTLSFAIPTETGPAPATKRLSEMRLVGSLFQPNDASGIINATYDRLQEAGQVKATYQDMLAKGRVNEAQRYLQENLNAYAESGLQTSFKSYMQNIMKSENAIRASSMPPDEKRRVLDELKQQKIAFAKTVREQSDRTRLQ